MARQYLQEGPAQDPPIAATLSADAALTAVLLWNPLQYTKFYGDEARPGRTYVVEATGILTTATTGALTISPGITTTNAAGTTLGASAAQTVPATAFTAQPWYLRSHWTVRTIGAPGASNATIIGGGFWHGPTLPAAGGATLSTTFGGTSAVFDQSVANAIAFTKTLTVAGSFTVNTVFGYWIN